MKNYGKILKEHRTEKGKTLLDVEKATGISNQNLNGLTLDELVGR